MYNAALPWGSGLWAVELCSPPHYLGGREEQLLLFTASLFTALGQWAVELLYTASLPWGSGQALVPHTASLPWGNRHRNSCCSLPHYLGAVATAARVSPAPFHAGM